jgi:hypothetical protein
MLGAVVTSELALTFMYILPGLSMYKMCRSMNARRYTLTTASAHDC